MQFGHFLIDRRELYELGAICSQFVSNCTAIYPTCNAKSMQNFPCKFTRLGPVFQKTPKKYVKLGTHWTKTVWHYSRIGIIATPTT